MGFITPFSDAPVTHRSLQNKSWLRLTFSVSEQMANLQPEDKPVTEAVQAVLWKPNITNQQT